MGKEKLDSRYSRFDANGSILGVSHRIFKELCPTLKQADRSAIVCCEGIDVHIVGVRLTARCSGCIVLIATVAHCPTVAVVWRVVHVAECAGY